MSDLPSPPVPFLSDAWIERARAVKASHGGNPVDVEGLVVNVTITGMPFGPSVLELHSEHGPMVGWEPGHAARPAVSLTLDHALARLLVLDPTFEVLAQASASGQLRVEGDTGAMERWWRTRIGNPDLVEVEAEIRALTA